MGKKERLKKSSEIYSSYHIPSMPNYYKRPKNSIYINPSNSLEHEIAKLKVCYEFRKLGIDFITEAVENKKDKDGKQKRRDIVNLNTGDIVEIECDKTRAKRFEGEKGVIVIKLWEAKMAKELKEPEVDSVRRVVRYKISKDGKGLLAYFKGGNYYHIHSNELSPLEKWIKRLLIKKKK